MGRRGIGEPNHSGSRPFTGSESANSDAGGASDATRQRSSVMLDLASAVATQLDSCLADTRRVVLVGYPEHHNVGDNAIWVATIFYLRSRGIAVTHLTNHRLYDVATVKRKLSSDAALLLLGGGNFGDLYPESQQLREAIVGDFPNTTILQMPQSVYFDEAATRDATLERFAAHPRLTVLARDEQSLRALSGAGLKSRLCPDVAHLLLPSLHARPGSGTLVLARADKERAHPTDVYPSSWKDWDMAPRDAPEQIRRALRLVSIVSRLGPSTEVKLWQHCWTTFAKVSLARGVRLIEDYETVVTDRLHGVIISRMLGRRVIAVDNSYGKVFGYLDTWLRHDPWIERAPDHSTAIALALQN